MTLRAALLVAVAATMPAPAAAIPAFARKYRTSCSTCHTAAPKLNVLGEAFRLNGYRMPENEQLLRREEAVPLGEEPVRDLWPRAIWPADIPASVPLALRLQLDGYVARAGGVRPRTNLEFPHEIYLLAGTSIGESVAAFLETEWAPGEEPELVQAKVGIQDPLPFLPPRALTAWIGRQNLYLFTFADRQIDRAGRLPFRWQEYRPADVVVTDPAGATLSPLNAMPVTEPQAALVATGLLRGRVAWSASLAQGAGGAATDNNERKDLAYTLRWKIGGLRLDGTYPAGGGPVIGGHGQLLDRSIILEHFGYVGGEPAAGGATASYRAFGLAARLLTGPLDLGVGWVDRRDDDAFGAAFAGTLTQRSLFAKVEVLAFPWLIGSLKAEHFDVSLPPSVVAAGYAGAFGETRVMPGAIALVRQNVRAVVEADLFTRHRASAGSGSPRPATLWFRLDVAF